MRKQFCIYTRDFAQCKGIFKDLHTHNIAYEAHINRTRFWLHSELALHQKFYIRYSTLIHCVDHETNHSLGI